MVWFRLHTALVVKMRSRHVVAMWSKMRSPNIASEPLVRFHQKKTLTFFVLLCLPALFLTFGKVNGAKIDFFFREGGGLLDIWEGQRCQNRPFFLGERGLLDIREGQRCQNRPFFRGRGGVQI